jgi:hypothetical protein
MARNSRIVVEGTGNHSLDGVEGMRSDFGLMREPPQNKKKKNR